MEFLNALFTAAFDNNIVFVQMVGMVSVIVLALRPQDSVRFGLALWAASAVSGIVGWPIYYLLLQPWGLDYLAPMAYLLVSATCVFFVGAVATANKPVEERRSAMAMCTIVALNACTLAVPLSNAAAGCEFPVGVGSAIGAGMGAFIAVVLFAARPAHLACDCFDHVPGVLRRVRSALRALRVRRARMFYVVAPALVMALIALVCALVVMAAVAIVNLWGTHPLEAWAERLRVSEAEREAERAVLDARIEAEENGE